MNPPPSAPPAPPEFSFLLPVFNGGSYLRDCLASLEQTVGGGRWEAILVDDCSTDGTRDLLHGLSEPYRVVLRGAKHGYAANVNHAASLARAPVLGLLNQDLIFTRGWLEPMRDLLRDRPDAGLVGNVQLSPVDRRYDHLGVVFGADGMPRHFGKHSPICPFYGSRAWRAVTAACCLVRRDVFLRAGGFDEEFINGSEDVDLCLRLGQMGCRHYVAYRSVIFHHVSITEGRHEFNAANEARLMRKWRPYLQKAVVPHEARLCAFHYLLRYSCEPWNYNGAKLADAILRVTFLRHRTPHPPPTRVPPRVEITAQNPRIVLVRPDRVGDVVLSTSCLAALRRRFPRASLCFVAHERMRPLLDGHPDVDRFLASSRAEPGVLRELGPDVVVHLHPDAAWCRAWADAGVPIRIGYGGDRLARFLTHSLPDNRLNGQKHEAESNLDLLAVLGVTPGGPLVPVVHLPEAARVSLQQTLPWSLENTSYVVVNLTAHSTVARWPAARFVELARWLVSTQQLHVIVTGADGEDPSVRQFRRMWREERREFCDLAGRTDLAELGWLLHHARVVITRNTGTSHLAAAVGCPVVDLFGRPGAIYGPTRWRPLTEKAVIVTGFLPRCRFESRARHWQRCFESISVEEVQRATHRALQFSADREGKNRS